MFKRRRTILRECKLERISVVVDWLLLPKNLLKINIVFSSRIDTRAVSTSFIPPHMTITFERNDDCFIVLWLVIFNHQITTKGFSSKVYYLDLEPLQTVSPCLVLVMDLLSKFNEGKRQGCQLGSHNHDLLY